MNIHSKFDELNVAIVNGRNFRPIGHLSASWRTTGIHHEWRALGCVQKFWLAFSSDFYLPVPRLIATNCKYRSLRDTTCYAFGRFAAFVPLFRAKFQVIVRCFHLSDTFTHASIEKCSQHVQTLDKSVKRQWRETQDIPRISSAYVTSWELRGGHQEPELDPVRETSSPVPVLASKNTHLRPTLHWWLAVWWKSRKNRDNVQVGIAAGAAAVSAAARNYLLLFCGSPALTIRVKWNWEMS